jgi:fructose-bisphosphate aldolase class I
MNLQALSKIATDLVAPRKGILAADESSGTIKKRFDSINVESTENNRRDYREMLFTTDQASQFISGIILFDETMRQNGKDGVSLVKTITNHGMIPGIKVDKGAKPLAGSTYETITEGLDGLRERLEEYNKLGAKFTKWRGVIEIGDSIPTQYCIKTNAHALARFATLSQEAGLVPIVEPEVLMDGSHDIDTCLRVTEMTLREVYYELGCQKVALEGTLLKPNMVLSGKNATDRATTKEVADKTIACLMNTVPSSVPGIVFLSGGQSDEDATVNLDSINKAAKEVRAPWQLSFSYGRGLQATPLNEWGGIEDNSRAAQNSFYQRAKITSAAREGVYSS